MTKTKFIKINLSAKIAVLLIITFLISSQNLFASNWVSVSAGIEHTLAIRNDGTLWAWGSNSNGQLGLGATGNVSTPAQVGTAAGWVSVSVGVDNSFAVRQDGTLWAWGRNNRSQLGLGNNRRGHNVPNQVGTDTSWASISAGGSHTIAIKTDGSLWAWGHNRAGQLGLGDYKGHTDIPIQVGAETDWVSVSAGVAHSLAVKQDGTLWTWGDNLVGQLGLGDSGRNTGRDIPTQVGTDTDWVTVSAGGHHNLAVRQDGTLWAWGRNNLDQLGLVDSEDTSEMIVDPFATPDNRFIPTQVGADTDWASVSAGEQHSLAVKQDGTFWAWGANFFGVLGMDEPSVVRSPTQVGIKTGWASISTGKRHSVAVKEDGTLWVSGRNDRGQLGLGDTEDRSAPTRVFAGDSVVIKGADQPVNSVP